MSRNRTFSSFAFGQKREGRVFFVAFYDVCRMFFCCFIAKYYTGMDVLNNFAVVRKKRNK